MPTFDDSLLALDVLREALFPELPPPPPLLARELRALLAVRRLNRGRTLIAQGGPTPALYAVLSGEIASRVGNDGGQDSLLEHVRPVQLFGLTGFVTGLPSRYEALATCATQLLVIGPAAYAALMDGWPGFARALLHNFAARYDGTLHLLESARHRRSGERLQLALQQLCRERGEAQRGGGWRVKATQAELAQLAGVTRQSANSWLREEARAGRLRAGYGCLVLLA